MLSFYFKNESRKTQEEINDIRKKQDEKNEHLQNIKLFIASRTNIFRLKPKYNSIIPLKTYTCWHTKELPPLMRVNYEKMTKRHPDFTHYLFDENDCYNFISDNFDNSVLEAYNTLVPSAYKSDLWRYCVLYINGGIYFDIKFYCVNDFKLTALTEKEYFVRDLEESGGGTLNGLMSVKPKNEIMLKCIRQIVENVKNTYYGNGCLDPSGPGLLSKYFTKKEKENLELHFSRIHVKNLVNECVVVFNNVTILRQYSGYRYDQTKKHYSELWNEKEIYNKIH
jgi:mannosyltransferase OCH1-like enzyme